jgi:hypothetical protein
LAGVAAVLAGLSATRLGGSSFAERSERMLHQISTLNPKKVMTIDMHFVRNILVPATPH